MKPYILKDIIDNVLRLTKGNRQDIQANWNGIHMPVAFTGRRGSVVVLLTPTEVVHNGDDAAISVTISSKPTADFKGAIELTVFPEQMPYLAGWISEFIVLSEYRRIHELILKKLYQHERLGMVSSIIEIKKKRG